MHSPWFLKSHCVVTSAHRQLSDTSSKLEEEAKRCCTEAAVHEKQDDRGIAVLRLPSYKECDLKNKKFHKEIG